MRRSVDGLVRFALRIAANMFDSLCGWDRSACRTCSNSKTTEKGEDKPVRDRWGTARSHNSELFPLLGIVLVLI